MDLQAASVLVRARLCRSHAERWRIERFSTAAGRRSDARGVFSGCITGLFSEVDRGPLFALYNCINTLRRLRPLILRMRFARKVLADAVVGCIRLLPSAQSKDLAFAELQLK